MLSSDRLLTSYLDSYHELVRCDPWKLLWGKLPSTVSRDSSTGCTVQRVSQASLWREIVAQWVATEVRIFWKLFYLIPGRPGPRIYASLSDLAFLDPKMPTSTSRALRLHRCSVKSIGMHQFSGELILGFGRQDPGPYDGIDSACTPLDPSARPP